MYKTNSFSFKIIGKEDKECSTDESQENSFSTNDEISKSAKKKKTKNILNIKKKPSEICYALNMMENLGNFILKISESQKLYIIKIKKIDFPDASELFEKGRHNFGEYFKQEIGSIPDITFWNQRYYYYSLFDKGIQMDCESWWSVTPEELAKYTASLVKDKIVCEGFCGSGGNVIQFSKFGKKVYAVDIDINKIMISKNNCKVYNCPNNIEFIHSDFLEIGNHIRADYVFLSPPWGGIKYKDSEVYNIKELMSPNIFDIVRTSLQIAPRIIFFLPRTLQLDELHQIIEKIQIESEKGPRDILFDVHILNSANKIKALMIIFSNDLSSIDSDDIKEYLNSKYDNIFSERSFNSLVNISKVIGAERFIKAEIEYSKNLKQKERTEEEITLNNNASDGLTDNVKIKNLEENEENEDIFSDLINYYMDNSLNPKEKNKLKHLELSYDKMILSQTQKKNKKRRNKI